MATEFYTLTLIFMLKVNRRNAIRLEHSTWPLNQIFSIAAGMLQDFLNSQDDVPVAVQVPPDLHWCPPEQFQYKANFDGAVFKSSNSAGLGVVICNNKGAVIGALSMHIPLPHSVAEVEALACRRAVQFAIEIGLHKVIFEGDAAVVIQATKTGSALGRPVHVWSYHW